MAQSKNEPDAAVIQEKCLIPCNVHEIQVENEDGTTETHYEYEEVEFPEQYIPPFDMMQDLVMQLLGRRVNEFINSHYNQGTQNTLQSYAIEADHDGRDDIYAECRKIFNWVDDVLAYYDARKQDMTDASDLQALKWVQWDYGNDVPPGDGLPGRNEIKAMFN